VRSGHLGLLRRTLGLRLRLRWLMNSGAAVVPPHLLHLRLASPLLVRLGFLVWEAINQLAVGDHESKTIPNAASGTYLVLAGL
jgi:hypothetical protein